MYVRLPHTALAAHALQKDETKRRVALQMPIHLAEYNGLSMGCRVALLVAPGYTSPASAQVTWWHSFLSVVEYKSRKSSVWLAAIFAAIFLTSRLSSITDLIASGVAKK